jgi:hypothetical protein
MARNSGVITHRSRRGIVSLQGLRVHRCHPGPRDPRKRTMLPQWQTESQGTAALVSLYVETNHIGYVNNEC